MQRLERLRPSLYLAAILTTAGWLAGCAEEPPSQTPASDQRASEQGPVDQEPVLVIRMTDEMRFEPAEVVVQPGDTVEWVNEGRMPHTVTARRGNAPIEMLPEGAEPWDSQLLQAGERYRHTFMVPGEYRYVCSIHLASDMAARISVEAEE